MQERQTDPGRRVSRRTALHLGGGALAAALSVDGVRSLVTAQTATVTTSSVPSIVQQWIAAWNSSDPAASLDALYTSTGTYEDVPSGRKSSPGDIAGFLSGFVSGLSGITLTLTDAFATATWAAAEYTFAATNQGTYPGVTGKQFSVRVATIFQVQGDRIQRSSDYYDLGTIAAQLAPAATPVPATPPATVPATAPATVPATVPATPVS